nr:unnamed protein product [Digitaria exilis]
MFFWHQNNMGEQAKSEDEDWRRATTGSGSKTRRLLTWSGAGAAQSPGGSRLALAVTPYDWPMGSRRATPLGSCRRRDTVHWGTTPGGRCRSLG